MKKNERIAGPWYFGSFIVYAPDPFTADTIYELALETVEDKHDISGGTVKLADGREGYWELVSAGEARLESSLRHSGR